jgi:hypothetical protein
MNYDTGSRPEVSQLKEEALRQSIREVFFTEVIRQLLQFEEKANTRTTREEFVRKLDILFRLLGPVYGRLEWEGLHRILDVSFDVQLNAGAFPPPPQSILDSDGQIDVIFQNPIARAQRAGDAEALTMAMVDLAPLVERFPGILDRLDPDKTADGIYDLRGVPAAWLRNDQELADYRAAAAAQAQQENALAQADMVAGAIGKAAPMVKALPPGQIQNALIEGPA